MNKTSCLKKFNRIFYCLIITIFFQTYAYGQNPGLSLSESSIPLQKLFGMIEKQSNYLFSYVDEDIKDLKISVDVQHANIQTILNQVLANTTLTYEINDRYITILKKSTATSEKSKINISGTVTDSKGEALTGVSILIKGTNTGAITDINGKYNINVPNKDVILVFSYLGFVNQEVTIGYKDKIDVELIENDNLLEEIVVIGYGTAKRKDLTGAISSLSSEQLTESPALSLNQSLQGKSAGVQVTLGDNTPGGGVSVLIRGKGSINQSNEPIYVVDGIIMQGTLNNINVEDIASINILKDASAAAIYGSSAANGVVIVTTKRGQEGKGKISVSARTSIQHADNLPTMLNAQQLAEMRIEGNVNAQLDEMYRNNPGITKDEYRSAFNGLKNQYLNEYPLSMFSEQERQTLLNNQSYNWYDEVVQNGIVQDYTVSFSGMTEKSNYYISAGYYDNKGLITGSNYQRFSFRVNLEQKMNNWLKIGVNSNYSNSNTAVAGATVETALGANPLYPFVVDGKQPLSVPFYTSEGLSNPILSKNIDNDINQGRYSVNAYLTFSLTKDLTLLSSMAADVLNSFTGYFAPSTIKEGFADKGRGQITNESWRNLMQDNTLTYVKQFDSKHRLDALIGNTVQSNDYRGNNQYGIGFATNEMGYNSIGSASEFPSASQWSRKTQWRIASFIGRLNYTLDDKYIFTATGRYDGNSKYGADNKWGFFPSLATGWRISSEKFMKNFTFLDDMKIRASWGQTGNSNIEPYASYTKLTPGITVDAEGKPINTIQNTDQLMGNPQLRWERQQQFNLGMDILAVKNRIRFSLDVYTKKSNDLVLRTPLPITTGFSEMYSNVGELQNKGIEISLGGLIIDGPVKWNVDFNWSANRNKLTKLYGGLTERMNNQNDPTNAALWVGEPLGTIYTYQYDGIWQWEDSRESMDLMKDGEIGGDTYYPGENKIADLDNDNVVTTADRKIVGYTDPKGFGGFSSSVTYKNFGLDMVFNYVYGNKIFNRSYHEYTLGAGYGFQNLSSDVLDRWTVDNPDASIPRVHANNLDRMIISSRLVQDGSYMRFKTATLSYNFTKKMLKSVSGESLRVYITGENLWTLTNFKGADPESPGAWGESYPNARAFSFGINMSF